MIPLTISIKAGSFFPSYFCFFFFNFGLLALFIANLHSNFFFRFSYYTEGNSQTFKAKGTYTLTTGNDFTTEVWKDPQSELPYAKGTAGSAAFQDLMASFGLNPEDVPDSFAIALK